MYSFRDLKNHVTTAHTKKKPDTSQHVSVVSITCKQVKH